METQNPCLVEIQASTALRPAGIQPAMGTRGGQRRIQDWAKPGTEGISLDCRLRFWRVGSIGQESGESELYKQ